MIVVCGPRIDPDSLPSHEGLELVAYVDRLSRHLAACDVAVTQGGLTTCMELAAARTPFVYFPLRRHFEQNLHVRHRLERYGAGHADGPRHGDARDDRRRDRGGARGRRRAAPRSSATARRAPRGLLAELL